MLSSFALFRILLIVLPFDDALQQLARCSARLDDEHQKI
jgi:hypothetical protein